MRAGQKLFDTTGGVHAAAAFDRNGEVVVVREDIGRHNAVDKVVGRLLLDGRLPARDLGLCGQRPSQLRDRAEGLGGGFAALVAVSAPSSLAVDAARPAGMTLAGFARPGRLNVYAPADLRLFVAKPGRGWETRGWPGSGSSAASPFSSRCSCWPRAADPTRST